jgi:hypothetical protein
MPKLQIAERNVQQKIQKMANLQRALIERPYSRLPQAVGAVYDQRRPN